MLIQQHSTFSIAYGIADVTLQQFHSTYQNHVALSLLGFFYVIFEKKLANHIDTETNSLT